MMTDGEKATIICFWQIMMTNIRFPADVSYAAEGKQPSSLWINGNNTNIKIIALPLSFFLSTAWSQLRFGMFIH